MSQREFIKKICNKFDVPEEFIVPTLNYFLSHQKNKPHLFNSFKERVENAKKISKKPKPINLDFKLEIPLEYKYILIKTSKKYIKNKGDINETIIAAKNWRRDEILEPKLLVFLNTPSAVRVRMNIRGDGGITKSGYVFYSNTSKVLLNRFKKDFFQLIGKCKYNIHDNKINFSKTASRLFYDKLGYLTGTENQYDWGIDKDIMDANKKIKGIAIGAYFDDEGRFHSNSLEIVKSRDLSFVKKDKLKKIIENPRKYPKYAPKFLLDLKEMIESFNVEVKNPYFYKGDLLLTVDNQGYIRQMAGWRLRICGEENIRIFHEKMGFTHPKRKKIVENYLKNIKVHKAQKNKSWLLALEKCKELTNNAEIICFSNLLSISNRSNTQVRRWIYDLKNRGILKEKPYIFIKKRDKFGRIKENSEKEYYLS